MVVRYKGRHSLKQNVHRLNIWVNEVEMLSTNKQTKTVSKMSSENILHNKNEILNSGNYYIFRGIIFILYLHSLYINIII